MFNTKKAESIRIKTQEAFNEFQKLSEVLPENTNNEIKNTKSEVDAAIVAFENGQIEFDELTQFSNEFLMRVSDAIRSKKPFSERFALITNINKKAIIYSVIVFAVLFLPWFFMILLGLIGELSGQIIGEAIAAFAVFFIFSLAMVVFCVPFIYAFVVKRFGGFAYSGMATSGVVDVIASVIYAMFSNIIFAVFAFFIGLIKITVAFATTYIKDLALTIKIIKGYFILKKAVAYEESGEIESHRNEIEGKLANLGI